MTNYVLNLIYQQFDRLKSPKIIKNSNTLEPCIRHFRNVYGLSCVHEIQRRFTRGNELFIIDDIDRHWWYDKDNYPPQAHPFELIQNPEMVYKKGRLKDAIGIIASKKLEKSTERDSSQFELINTTISGDISSRKEIYKIGKKGE